MTAPMQPVVFSCEGERLLGIMHPGRADVIAAGAVILDQIVKRSGE